MFLNCRSVISWDKHICFAYPFPVQCLFKLLLVCSNTPFVGNLEDLNSSIAKCLDAETDRGSEEMDRTMHFGHRRHACTSPTRCWPIIGDFDVNDFLGERGQRIRILWGFEMFWVGMIFRTWRHFEWSVVLTQLTILSFFYSKGHRVSEYPLWKDI